MIDNDLIFAMQEVLDDIRGKNSLPAREYVPTDVKALRQRFNLSQSEFARLFHVSIKTLQQWEQGRRYPQGPAKILLKIIEKNPKTVLDVLH